MVSLLQLTAEREELKKKLVDYLKDDLNPSKKCYITTLEEATAVKNRLLAIKKQIAEWGRVGGQVYRIM